MAAPIGARRCLGNLRPLLRCVLRPRVPNLIHLLRHCHGVTHILPSSPAVLSRLSPGLTIQPDFISPEEEAALCGELEPVLRKKRYESGHWDDAIHGFREIERLHWSPGCSTILQRVRDKAFTPEESQLSLVHVLDLQKEGYIKPHVDSVKFCGTTIAGICLLSSSVMRLVSVDNAEETADILLPRRCLYIIRITVAPFCGCEVVRIMISGVARYEFTHEILRDEESFFNGLPVQRERRISVICRNLPAS